MYLASLAGVAAFAALGQAVLLPPTLTPADKPIVEALPFEHNVESETRAFIVDCPGCPVALPDAVGALHNVADLESRLVLNFTIAHDDGIDRLLLNDAQIYPNNPSVASLLGPVTARQIVKSPNRERFWDDVATPKLGYKLLIDRPPLRHQTQLDLVNLKFQIIEVGGQFIHGFDEINIRLLETLSQKLMIGGLKVIPQHATSTPSKDAECKSLLCKLTAILNHMHPKTKGCGRKSGQHSEFAHGRRPHHANHDDHPSHKNHGDHDANGRHDHHQQHYQQHHHHHSHHTMIRFVKGVALHVVVPLAIGVMVGITASFVGFLAATFVVFLWRLLFRRNRAPAYDQVPQEDTVAEESEKSKIALQEEQMEAPPVYEEAVEPKA
ncbi:hypothetical protein B7463_g3922, partial [Scytalidium lignicola]